ncbi:transposase [Streptomyces swartbergensis]|uniref:transposase n=1 Tax=Streptomyces swartbergensis TaxID=487165 RepID=UPI00380E0A7D
MVRRHELTDVQWRKIEPPLPGNAKPGGQVGGSPQVINGVLFRARTGVPWPDLPGRYTTGSHRPSCRGLRMATARGCSHLLRPSRSCQWCVRRRRCA